MAYGLIPRNREISGIQSYQSHICYPCHWLSRGQRYLISVSQTTTVLSIVLKPGVVIVLTKSTYFLVFCYGLPLVIISFSNVAVWCQNFNIIVPQTCVSAGILVKRVHQRSRDCFCTIWSKGSIIESTATWYFFVLFDWKLFSRTLFYYQ